VPDAIFAHPRLAAIYDAFDGHRGDLAAYLAITDGLGANRVLGIDCGTGCLAVLLAAIGRTIMGIDPAEASLEVAKSKDKAAAVRWVLGDATSGPAFGADLAVMTGNVAQVFLTDQDWAQALQASTPPSARIVRHLPGGDVQAAVNAIRQAIPPAVGSPFGRQARGHPDQDAAGGTVDPLLRSPVRTGDHGEREQARAKYQPAATATTTAMARTLSG
jgi:SAM-dependent methyltransferase